MRWREDYFLVLPALVFCAGVMVLSVIVIVGTAMAAIL